MGEKHNIPSPAFISEIKALAVESGLIHPAAIKHARDYDENDTSERLEKFAELIWRSRSLLIRMVK